MLIMPIIYEPNQRVKNPPSNRKVLAVNPMSWVNNNSYPLRQQIAHAYLLKQAFKKSPYNYKANFDQYVSSDENVYPTYYPEKALKKTLK